jgi:hypothetical protein
VISVLQQWVELHWHDFGLKSELNTNLSDFVDIIGDSKEFLMEYAILDRTINQQVYLMSIFAILIVRDNT